MSQNVQARIVIEKTIARAAVEALLAKGCTLGVFDSEEVTLVRSRDAEAVMAALMTSDDDWLLVWFGPKPEGAQDLEGSDLFHGRGRARGADLPDGWCHFVYGNEGWDVLADNTGNLEHALSSVHKLAEAIDQGQFAIAPSKPVDL